MKDVVMQRICERINEARYFSIIADYAQDSSKAETTVLYHIESLTHVCTINDMSIDIVSTYETTRQIKLLAYGKSSVPF